MKAEIKAKWLEALRSGKIKQADRVLRDQNNAMCCLGVLLDVYSPDGWGKASYNTFTNSTCYPHSMASADRDFLTTDARELLGLEFNVPREEDVGFRRAANHLARWNDNGKSFAEIADWIEANIPAES